MSNPLADLEVNRLTSFLTAIAQHGWTTWADTSCGSGGIGGQAITTEYHGEVMQHLITGALMGSTLKETADDWAEYVPGSARLDEKPRAPRRRGPDGRPV